MKKYLVLGLLALKVYRTFFAAGEQEKEQKQEEHQASTAVSGLGVFISGLAIGAIATFLTTPTSGTAARENLRGKVESMRVRARRNADCMRETFGRSKEEFGRVRSALIG